MATKSTIFDIHPIACAKPPEKELGYVVNVNFQTREGLILLLTKAMTITKSSHHSFAADNFLATKRAIAEDVARAIKEIVTPLSSNVRLW